MTLVGSLQPFEHDHAELTSLVIELRDTVRRLAADEAPSEGLHDSLEETLDVLREELLSHFAREEEGLFPFVSTELPHFGDQVTRLQSAHDRICGIAVRMSHARRNRAQVIGAFERFDEIYSEHAQEERRFLQAVAAELDDTQRAELLQIVEGL